jgi:hypothetical protein
MGASLGQIPKIGNYYRNSKKGKEKGEGFSLRCLGVRGYMR